MENSSSAIFITNMDAKIIEYSNEFIKILEYSHEEAKNIYVYDFEIIHTKKQIFENINKVTDKSITFESQYKTKTGKILDVSVKIVKIIIEGKQYIHTSLSDITQKNLLLKTTKQQKEEFETIFQYAKDGIAIIDFKGNFLKVNPAFYEITGYKESKLLQQNFNDLVTNEYKEKNLKAIKEVIKIGKVENYEECFVVANK